MGFANATASGCPRVLLVDASPIFSDGVRRLLATMVPGMTVCGEADTLAEARRMNDEFRPDLILLDSTVSAGGGVGLLEESRGWASPPKVLVVTAGTEEDQEAVDAMRLGAVGVVSKRVTGAALISIVRQVCSGRAYFSVGMVERLLSRRG